KHYYSIYGGDLKGKKVIVQGWGNVGAAGAYYLAQSGAKIVGIIDREGGLINEEGFSFEAIKELFLLKEGNQLKADNMLSYEEVNKRIWSLDAQVFIPCAASRLITKEQVEMMIQSGMEVIAAGANVPFADQEIFFGPIAEYTDSKISIIPDFISNCGMARVFAYLMTNSVEMTDEGIFNDTSTTIKTAMEEAHEVSSSKTNIAKTAFTIALNKLV
ncbi:MAG: amino acid dehydrogenase, partial [Vicingaceae bacterium]